MRLNLSMVLNAEYILDPPNIGVYVDNDLLYSGILEKQTLYNYDKNVNEGNHCIDVYFYDDHDQDKSVIVKSIKFFDIESELFIYNGIYTPIYAYDYISGDDKIDKTPQTYGYMGWKGKWHLDFSVPIFTWLHEVEQLGWIYPN